MYFQKAYLLQTTVKKLEILGKYLKRSCCSRSVIKPENDRLRVSGLRLPPKKSSESECQKTRTFC